MKISNSVNSLDIELFGGVGDSWFEDSITLDSVNNKIKTFTGDEINIKLSSLGGDVNHALAIHDILKINKAKVNVSIIGMTASAGTIIALAGDNVSISENAMFLIHNVWTVAQGNADDLRNVADDLDSIDSILINIYKKKTGKRASQIASLMKEERWITPAEAKEWGFVDEVFEPMPIAASIYKEINNSNLPKIKNMEEKTILEKISGLFKNNESEINAKVDEKVNEVVASVKAENEEMKNKISESEAKIEAKNNEIVSLRAQLSTLEAEKTELQNKVAELQINPIDPKADVDPLIGDVKPHALDEIAKKIKNEFKIK